MNRLATGPSQLAEGPSRLAFGNSSRTFFKKKVDPIPKIQKFLTSVLGNLDVRNRNLFFC